MRTKGRLLAYGALLAAGVAVAAAAFFHFRRGRPEFRTRDFENTVYSQAGEDGLLERIFQIIQPTHRYAIEFGAGDGIDLSNVRRLITQKGWGGLLIEGDARRAEQLRENYTGHADVRTLQAWVFPANVELLFEENGAPRDPDLLVIDIDSNDYYVWRAIREYRPKVVVIEYNGMFRPPQKMVIAYHPLMYWDGADQHFGASLQSLYDLGKKKGYELVGVTERGVNLFFVDRQYSARFGMGDNSPARLFRPYNYVRVYREADLRSGVVPPPSPDLLLEPQRIEKRLRFDR